MLLSLILNKLYKLNYAVYFPTGKTTVYLQSDLMQINSNFLQCA